MHSIASIAAAIAQRRRIGSRPRNRQARRRKNRRKHRAAEPSGRGHDGNHLASARVRERHERQGLRHQSHRHRGERRREGRRDFYRDVFNLEKLDEGEGDAFFKIGEHQFLAMFEVGRNPPEPHASLRFDRARRGAARQVREKLTNKYGIKLIPPFRCDFIDPFGNRVQVVDLHDESIVWLLPYQEVQDVFRAPAQTESPTKRPGIRGRNGKSRTSAGSRRSNGARPLLRTRPMILL